MSITDITRPKHYGGDANPHEPRKVIRHHGLNFNLGTVVKHILRAGKKPDNPVLVDLLKARQYLDFEIESVTIEMREAEAASRQGDG